VVLISVGIMALAALLAVVFSRLISRPIVLLAKETEKIEHLILESDLRVKSKISEICLMDHAIASMRIALRSFSRYIPKEIVKRLVEKGQDISLGGEKKEVTIFFSDIAGFTTIAENCPTEELLELLASYFDALSKIILAHQGTIDKYMGDSIMAFWGAPIDMPDHARQCCLAALKCKVFLAAFNARNKKEGRPEFNTRMGICSGPVIVGNIGTEERINYTVIGDSVNTASRLQAAGKTYHTAILINEETKRMVGDEFLVRPLDVIGLRGKKKETKIFELVGLASGDPALRATEEQTALCSAFTEAFSAFQSGDKNRAKELFEKIHQQFPEDHAAALYLERLR